MFSALRKHKANPVVIDELEVGARKRALSAVNGGWHRPGSKDDGAVRYMASSSPLPSAPGQINLIRAIVDESADLITADKEELATLIIRQEFLTNRIAAYEELQSVGNRHYSKLTVTLASNKSLNADA